MKKHLRPTPHSGFFLELSLNYYLRKTAGKGVGEEFLSLENGAGNWSHDDDDDDDELIVT